MQLPDFLIIGAMKAGTTTLYRDLLTNPAVFMPNRKEPNSLCSDRVLCDEGQEEYADLFRLASPDQICGEASTAYSKLPDVTGVPERAMTVLGPSLRVIYIVREPVARIVSHHYHSYITGLFGPNIDEEIHRQPSLLNYTRYGMQIRPWVEQFGRKNVMIVKFEDFVADRRRTIAEVSDFLGIAPRPERVDVEAVFNRSEGKPIRLSFWRAVRLSSPYRNLIQPLLPRPLRDRMREALHPKAPPRPAPPSDDTVRFIFKVLAEDAEVLRRLMNLGR